MLNLHHALDITRRQFLGNCQVGLGGLALSLLLGRDQINLARRPAAASNPMIARGRRTSRRK